MHHMNGQTSEQASWRANGQCTNRLLVTGKCRIGWFAACHAMCTTSMTKQANSQHASIVSKRWCVPVRAEHDGWEGQQQVQSN